MVIMWKEFQPLNLINSTEITFGNIIRAYMQSVISLATLYGVCRIIGMGFAHGLGL